MEGAKMQAQFVARDSEENIIVFYASCMAAAIKGLKKPDASGVAAMEHGQIKEVGADTWTTF